MKVTDIIAALDNMTEHDVRKINQAAYSILNSQRKQKIAAKKRDLCVGHTVSFDNGRKVGKIVKINRTKCIVDCGGLGNSWNVPMTMVTPR